MDEKFNFFSRLKEKSTNLKPINLFEKIKIIKIKKYKPPIHWEDDLHKIKGESKLLIFPKTENPVPDSPEIDSK